MLLRDHLLRGSSPIDWCEDNYVYNPFIAEFFNTVSNLPFLLIPPFLMHLHKVYGESIGRGIHCIWALLIIIGICSAYFHATLSLLGQLLDELAILWVVMAGIALWYPRAAIPISLRDKHGRKTFSTLVAVLALFITGMGFLEPSLNAFFLMSLGIPPVLLVIYNVCKAKDPRITSLARRSVTMWVLSVICWVSDRVNCGMWLRIGFPYLHGFWHVLIFLSAYCGVVLFAYFDVKQHHPIEQPVVVYWPKNSFELGIPYVTLKSKIKNEI